MSPPNPLPRLLLVFAACTLGLLSSFAEVRLVEQADRVAVTFDGKLFTEYRFKDVPRPFCYPVVGPGEKGMTRNYPMKEVAGEDRDHVHHRGLWYAHGDVNGHDFWAETAKAGKIVHQKFHAIESGKDAGLLKSENHWISAEGKQICSDIRTLRFQQSGPNRVVDFEITLKATNGELTLGDTKEGTMAIRIAESMRLKHGKKEGQGHIVNSQGVTDGGTWGKKAEWCTYYGPVDGTTMGISIFDHPSNPRHPTWWHVRDYGLFAANPFGVHDFEKKEKGTGNLKISPGESVTFRYRFIFHIGNEKEAGVAGLYEAYKNSAKPSGKNL
jgi:hypothetical protein